MKIVERIQEKGSYDEEYRVRLNVRGTNTYNGSSRKNG